MNPTKGGLDLRVIDHRALASYMTYKGFTVRTLAFRTGVNRSTIGHLRSGKRTTCSPEAAIAICKVLDVPTQIIFSDRSVERVSRNAA